MSSVNLNSFDKYINETTPPFMAKLKLKAKLKSEYQFISNRLDALHQLINLCAEHNIDGLDSDDVFSTFIQSDLHDNCSIRHNVTYDDLVSSGVLKSILDNMTFDRDELDYGMDFTTPYGTVGFDITHSPSLRQFEIVYHNPSNASSKTPFFRIYDEVAECGLLVGDTDGGPDEIDTFGQVLHYLTLACEEYRVLSEMSELACKGGDVLNGLYNIYHSIADPIFLPAMQIVLNAIEVVKDSNLSDTIVGYIQGIGQSIQDFKNDGFTDIQQLQWELQPLCFGSIANVLIETTAQVVLLVASFFSVVVAIAASILGGIISSVVNAIINTKPNTQIKVNDVAISNVLDVFDVHFHYQTMYCNSGYDYLPEWAKNCRLQDKGSICITTPWSYTFVVLQRKPENTMTGWGSHITIVTYLRTGNMNHLKFKTNFDDSVGLSKAICACTGYYIGSTSDITNFPVTAPKWDVMCTRPVQYAANEFVTTGEGSLHSFPSNSKVEGFICFNEYESFSGSTSHEYENWYGNTIKHFDNADSQAKLSFIFNAACTACFLMHMTESVPSNWRKINNVHQSGNDVINTLATFIDSISGVTNRSFIPAYGNKFDISAAGEVSWDSINSLVKSISNLEIFSKYNNNSFFQYDNVVDVHHEYKNGFGSAIFYEQYIDMPSKTYLSLPTDSQFALARTVAIIAGSVAAAGAMALAAVKTKKWINKKMTYKYNDVRALQNKWIADPTDENYNAYIKQVRKYNVLANLTGGSKINSQNGMLIANSASQQSSIIKNSSDETKELLQSFKQEVYDEIDKVKRIITG